MQTKRAAYCAVCVALLIAVQYALQFIAGVELVTVLLLCFCYVFGIRYGMITATAFSLLRCFLFGFYFNVVLLYLIYYNLFAVVAGALGKRRAPPWVFSLLLAALSVACLYFALAGIPISMLYVQRVQTMLWALFGITAALFVAHLLLVCFGREKYGAELACVTAVAAFMTVCFTLLDDVITPLVYGYSSGVAAAYFYTSFLAMLPQTICAAVSVFILFYPLKKLFTAYAHNIKT